MLHIINKMSLLSVCQPLLGKEDIVLLIEDAVYAAMQPQALLALPHWYVLSEDLARRGLSLPKTMATSQITYHQFVTLVVENRSIQCWY